MNTYEKEATDLLIKLKAQFGCCGIKTSFEDEGATFNDVLRIKEMCSLAGVDLHIKIGGPEAISDLKQAMTLGAAKVVAPLVESPFGLKKFVGAYNKFVVPYQINPFSIGINIESELAIKNLDQILEAPECAELSGITIGRCDLTFSMDLDRSSINNEKICKMVHGSFVKMKDKNHKTFMGGAVSVDSIPFIQKLLEGRLIDCVETRYVIFDLSSGFVDLKKGLKLAHLFELALLKGRVARYQSLFASDAKRVKMIEERLNSNKVDVMEEPQLVEA